MGALQLLTLIAGLAPDLVTLGVIACIPMLVALAAGIAVRGRLDQVRFRQVIVVLLVASVANLLWRTFVA